MVRYELEQARKIREDINMSQFLICKSMEDLSRYGEKMQTITSNHDLFSKVINQYIPNEDLKYIWVIERIHEIVNQLEGHIHVMEEIVSKSDVMIFWYGSDYQELEIVNSKVELMTYLKNNITNPCLEIDLYAEFS